MSDTIEITMKGRTHPIFTGEIKELTFTSEDVPTRTLSYNFPVLPISGSSVVPGTASLLKCNYYDALKSISPQMLQSVLKAYPRKLKKTVFGTRSSRRRGRC